MCSRLGAGLFLEGFLLEVFLDEVQGGLLGMSLTAVDDWLGLNDFSAFFNGPFFSDFSLLIVLGLLAKRFRADLPKESFVSLVPSVLSPTGVRLFF
jgi:hypothetical protein